MPAFAFLLHMVGIAAWAQEALPDPALTVAVDPYAEVRADLERRLAAAEAGQLQGAAEAATLRALLGEAATLADPESDPAARLEAARALGARPDPAALALLAGAADSRRSQVRAAAIAGLGLSPLPGAVDRLAAILNDAQARDASEVETPIFAAEALGSLQRPEAGQALYAAMASGELPGAVEREALRVLQERYPALLEQQGRPRGRTRPIGLASVLTTSAGAGGVLMSSIGVWGKSDLAVGIGAVGGAGLGAGLSGLWLSNQPLSNGQALRYGSDTAWGITGGVLAQYTLFGDNSTGSAEGGAAAMRALGATAGVLSGALQVRDRNPDPIDVLEQDLLGGLGLGLGMTIGTTASSGYRRGADSRAVAGGGLAGAAAGLVVGSLVSPTWEPDRADISLAELVAAEAGWVTGWAQSAAVGDVQPGSIGIGIFGGAAGGLALAQLVDPSPEQSALAAWGALLGNGLGAGVPLLAAADSDVATWSMLPTGVVGAVAGAALAPKIPLERGDKALLAFSVPMGLLEAAAVGAWLSERDLGLESSQFPGLVLTTGAATGLVVTGLAPHIDPQPLDVGFVASTTAWGAYHGSLLPIALESRGSVADLVLVSTLAADGFLVLGSVLVSPAVGFDPRRSLIPQLGGVGGATLGSLGALMFSTAGRDAARGALVGSTLGFVVGGLVESRRPAPAPRLAASKGGVLGRVLPDLPGEWSFSVLPAPDAEGKLGLQTQLRGVRW